MSLLKFVAIQMSCYIGYSMNQLTNLEEAFGSLAGRLGRSWLSYSIEDLSLAFSFSAFLHLRPARLRLPLRLPAVECLAL